MRASDARYAGELASALSGIVLARKGLRARLKAGGKMYLNIEAAEEVHGDPLAGYVHGGVLIEMTAAPQIAAAIEKFIRSELHRLKVRP